MKKTLIALAALAATGAFAQSAVTIDGILDAGYQSISYKGTTVQDIGGNGSSTSQINFRGTEDLGGGMKANFRVETDWNVVSTKANTGFVNTNAAATASGAPTFAATAGVAGSGGSSFANGEVRVGLSGGFGAVDMGVVNFNTLNTYLMGQPYGTAIGGGFRGVYVNDGAAVGTSAVRADNAIKYTSPSFAGFNVTLYNTFKNTKAGTTAGSGTYSTTIGAYNHAGYSEVGLNYGNGPLKASYSQLATDATDVTTAVAAAPQGVTTTVRTLAANYAVTSALTGYIMTQKVTNSTSTVDRGFTSVALGYTFGNNVITGMLGTGSDSGTGNATGGKTTTLASVGYDYNLSKRSAVYARYESITDDGGMLDGQKNGAGVSIDGTSNIRTRAAIGLRHAF